MTELSKTLKNPYYYINNGVLYNISDKEIDKDIEGASDRRKGNHLVTYITEPKELESGSKYYDLHNDEKVADTAGTYQVSTNKINVEECKKTFPYATINYIDDEENEYQEVLWLQNLIKEGDTYKDGKFVSYGFTYDSDYEFQVSLEITKLIEKETSFEQIIKKLPYYIFEPSLVKDKIQITTDEGTKKVTYNGTNGLFSTTKKSLKNYLMDVVFYKIRDFTNEKLKKYGFKLKDEGIIINDETVIDL
jgi:uncharacterized protein RhaS with RHS repeats